MAQNAKKRQQKLAARNARRSRRKMVKAKPVALATRIEQAAHWPVISARISVDLFEQGIGTALLVRQAVNGTMAFAHFLVDTWCMGVKDAYVKVLNPVEAAAWNSHISSNFDRMKPVSPEYLRKLILKSIEYSLSLGIQPATDYTFCSKILDGIDESQCRDEFAFGKDGKPMLMPGPNDSMARIRQIMESLHQSQGADNFDYIMPLDPTAVLHGEVYDRDGHPVQLKWIDDSGEIDDDDLESELGPIPERLLSSPYGVKH